MAEIYDVPACKEHLTEHTDLKAVYDRLKVQANEDFTPFIPDGGGEIDLYKDLNSLRDLVEKLCDERNDELTSICPTHEEFHYENNSDYKTINNLIDSGNIQPLLLRGYGDGGKNSPDQARILSSTSTYCATNGDQITVCTCDTKNTVTTTKCSTNTYVYLGDTVCTCDNVINAYVTQYYQTGLINYDGTLSLYAYRQLVVLDGTLNGGTHTSGTATSIYKTVYNTPLIKTCKCDITTISFFNYRNTSYATTTTLSIENKYSLKDSIPSIPDYNTLATKLENINLTSCTSVYVYKNFEYLPSYDIFSAGVPSVNENYVFCSSHDFNNEFYNMYCNTNTVKLNNLNTMNVNNKMYCYTNINYATDTYVVYKIYCVNNLLQSVHGYNKNSNAYCFYNTATMTDNSNAYCYYNTATMTDNSNAYCYYNTATMTDNSKAYCIYNTATMTDNSNAYCFYNTATMTDNSNADCYYNTATMTDNSNADCYYNTATMTDNSNAYCIYNTATMIYNSTKIYCYKNSANFTFNYIAYNLNCSSNTGSCTCNVKTVAT
jgi:hypothetical protein